MDDLSTLFPPRERRDAAFGRSRDASDELRRLVGSGAKAPNKSSSADGLAHLVGPEESKTLPDERSSAVDLARLVGPGESKSETGAADLLRQLGGASSGGLGPLSSGGLAPVKDQPGALAQLVGSADGADDRQWRAPELAQPGRRPLFNGRRKDGSVNLLSVAVAVVAVAILSGTVALAVVQRVTSGPADEAMVSLREREAELQNDTLVLQTAEGLYSASVSEASALAAAAGGVLVELRGTVDQASLDSAERARVALESAVEGSPETVVPTYRRGAIDEDSVEDISSAIDDIRVARDVIDALIEDARTSRAAIVEALTSMRNELRTVGSAIEAAAGDEVRSHLAPAQSFRSAVTDYAARVRTAQQAGADGLSEMSGYAGAVVALRVENARILDLVRSADDLPVRTPLAPTRSDSGGGGQSESGGARVPEDSGAGVDPTGGPSGQPSAEPSPESSARPDPETSPTLP